MPRKVKTAKDLGKALRDDIDEIEIEGDLVAKVIKIRATGRVAWAVAFVGLYDVLSGSCATHLHVVAADLK